MTFHETERNPVELLAEDFLARFRRGEVPSITDYVSKNPNYAEEIRQLFPALVMMEKAGPGENNTTAGSNPQLTIDSKSLKRLGDYQVLREIGRGGMGIVYEAEQKALGRHVALKVLPHSLSSDPMRLQRFRSEARFAARLHHTNIVPVFEVGESEGLHYYAMQYIQGQGLDEVIVELRRLRNGKSTAMIGTKQEAEQPRQVEDESISCSLANGLVSGVFHNEDDRSIIKSTLFQEVEQSAEENAESPSATEQSRDQADSQSNTVSLTGSVSDISHQSHAVFYRSVARIGLQVAEALAYAHRHKVMHRDIKPANLLLDAQGTVWVTDFGLAKVNGVDDLTHEGDIVGTLRYMAPERFKGTSNPKADLYSLGATLYELLTLQSPYDAKDYGSLIKKVLHEEPLAPRSLDPNIPRDLETILLKAIAKESEQRYDSAASMAEDLRRFLADRPIQARRTSWVEHAWKWCRRNPGWAAAVLATFGLLLLIAVGGSILNLQLKQALNDTENAEKDKTDKLWQSYLEKARAERSSGRVGQRFEALKAIREAAKIKVTPELRDEAVAALALPDVEVAQEWEGWPEDTVNIDFDASYRRFVRLNNKGELTVCQVTSQGEKTIAHLPDFGRPPIFLLRISPDGRFVTYGSSGIDEIGALRVWRVDTQEPWDVPGGITGSAIAFHPHANLLAVGQSEETISIFDLETKQRLKHIRLNQAIRAMAFHPQGELLAVAGGKVVRILNVKNQQERPPLVHAKPVTWLEGLAWHPDGQHLVTGGTENRLHLWDTLTGTEVMTSPENYPAPGVTLSLNHTGDYLACCGWGGGTQIWNLNTNRLVLNLFPLSPKFNQEASLLGWSRHANRLQLIRLEQGHEMRIISRISAPVTEQIGGSVISPDGRLLIFTSKQLINEPTFRQWLNFFDLPRCRQLASVELPMGADGQAVPRGFLGSNSLITGGYASPSFWPVRSDPRDEHLLRIGPPQSMAADSQPSLGLDTQGRVIAIPYQSSVLVLDRNRPGARQLIGPFYDVRRCAVSPSGRWIVTCGWHTDGKTPIATIWESGALRRVLDLPLVSTTDAQFSPNERWLVTYCASRGTELWDVASWKLRRRYGRAILVFMPDQEHVAISDQPGAIRIVQIESDREVFRLSGPEQLYYDPVGVSPDGTQLVAMKSWDKALYVWNLPELRASLRQVGMDWDWPEFPTRATDTAQPGLREVEIDPGFLHPQPFEDDRHTVGVYSFCLAMQPMNPEALWQRGLAFGRLGEGVKAVADYKLFLALVGPTDAHRAEALCRLLNNYRQQKDDVKAVAVLLELLDVSVEKIPWPDVVAFACNHYAWQFVLNPASAHPEQYVRIARKAAQMEPYNGAYQNSLGAVLYRVGRWQKAVECLERNLTLNQKEAGFDLYFLAMSYQQLGETAKAKDAYQRARAWHQAQTNLSAENQKQLNTFQSETAAVLGIQNLSN